MKLNFNKAAPVTEVPQPVKTSGFQIGTPKVATQPATLSEQVAAKPKSGLAAMLAGKKDADLDAPVQIAEKVAAAKIQLASESEKYVLDAEATDKLPQTVLDDFRAKMQHMIYAMNTQELPTAFHDVLNFAQEHPHLRGILRADDVRLVVRAARKSYGLVVAAKAGNKGKATKHTQLAKDIMADLADVSFSI